jgi:hypothetical protein
MRRPGAGHQPSEQSSHVPPQVQCCSFYDAPLHPWGRFFTRHLVQNYPALRIGVGAGFRSTMCILASMNAMTRSVSVKFTSFTALSFAPDLPAGTSLLLLLIFSSGPINHPRGSTACGVVAMHRDRYYYFWFLTRRSSPGEACALLELLDVLTCRSALLPKLVTQAIAYLRIPPQCSPKACAHA